MTLPATHTEKAHCCKTMTCLSLVYRPLHSWFISVQSEQTVFSKFQNGKQCTHFQLLRWYSLDEVFIVVVCDYVQLRVWDDGQQRRIRRLEIIDWSLRSIFNPDGLIVSWAVIQTEAHSYSVKWLTLYTLCKLSVALPRVQPLVQVNETAVTPTPSQSDELGGVGSLLFFLFKFEMFLFF